MAKRSRTTPNTCGRCMWFGNKWHGTSCKQEGAEDTTPVCPMFERIFDFTALREASPGMLRAKTALKQSSMNVPKFVLDELRTYLLAGGKGSVDWKHYVGRTDNQQSGKRLAHKMALLQAYKDRTIAVQDNIGKMFIIPPILRGEDVGSGFGADLMTNAYNFMNSVTENERQMLEVVFRDLLQYYAVKFTNFSIKPLTYIG